MGKSMEGQSSRLFWNRIHSTTRALEDGVYFRIWRLPMVPACVFGWSCGFSIVGLSRVMPAYLCGNRKLKV